MLRVRGWHTTTCPHGKFNLAVFVNSFSGVPRCLWFLCHVWLHCNSRVESYHRDHFGPAKKRKTLTLWPFPEKVCQPLVFISLKFFDLRLLHTLKRGPPKSCICRLLIILTMLEMRKFFNLVFSNSKTINVSISLWKVSFKSKRLVGQVALFYVFCRSLWYLLGERAEMEPV